MTKTEDKFLEQLTSETFKEANNKEVSGSNLLSYFEFKNDNDESLSSQDSIDQVLDSLIKDFPETVLSGRQDKDLGVFRFQGTSFSFDVPADWSFFRDFRKPDDVPKLFEFNQDVDLDNFYQVLKTQMDASAFIIFNNKGEVFLIAQCEANTKSLGSLKESIKNAFQSQEKISTIAA